MICDILMCAPVETDLELLYIKLEFTSELLVDCEEQLSLQ